MTVAGSAPRVFAVVPAAGVGTRMGGATPKQYLELHGTAVLVHTLNRLAGHPRIDRVVVAVAEGDSRFSALRASLPENCVAVTGGAERCHSVLAGLNHLLREADVDDWVLVHDAARPCLRREDIDRMLRELEASAVGGILAVPVRDTLKRCDPGLSIEQTIDRSALWHALTPQMFRLGMLAGALDGAVQAGHLVTDEAQAIELLGQTPRVVAGHSDNIKITLPEDLKLAALILTAQDTEQGD